MYITAYPVLGSIESYQIYIRRFVQNVDGRPHRIIHSCRIGYQPHTLTFQASEVLILQYLNPSLYSYLLCVHRPAKCEEYAKHKYLLHNKSFITLSLYHLITPFTFSHIPGLSSCLQRR